MSKEEKRLKINLELLIVGDGRTFINFWNHKNGDDVIVEVYNGKLYREGIEISIQGFIDETVNKF